MSKNEIERRPLLAAGAAAGLSAVLPSLSIAQTRPEGSGMAGDLTAEEIVRLLDLEPNATCGFVRVTFLSKQAIAPGGLPAPFADGRPLGSALYFLVTPGAPVRLHRISFIIIISGIRSRYSCCARTAAPNVSSSARTSGQDSESSF
jgi:hypothetical protein